MTDKKFDAAFLCRCALIATIYVVLTWLAVALGLASGVIQIRLSEMLCILPMFTSAAVPGLTIGCVLANLLTGCAVWDVLLGTVATFIGAVGTYLLRRRRLLAFLPPIVSNAAIVPWVLKTVYGVEEMYLLLVLTVTVGEILSVGVLGFFLYKALKKRSF